MFTIRSQSVLKQPTRFGVSSGSKEPKLKEAKVKKRVERCEVKTGTRKKVRLKSETEIKKTEIKTEIK